ncbi:MAG: hypothetical protein RJA36_2904 [Pseudomonadota bacterium]
MAACEPSGHLFGADDRCLHCGDPAPQIPEFLRGAREPATDIGAMQTELSALRLMAHTVLSCGEHHGAPCQKCLTGLRDVLERRR